MPQVIEFEVFDVTALDCIVRGGFRVAGVDYAGLRQNFANDEYAWDENDAGRWRGGASPLTVPSGLTIKDAVPLVRIPATERDTIMRVGTGNDVELNWTYLYGAGSIYPCRVQVYKCSDGSLVYDETSNDNGALVEGLEDGSYTAAVRIEGASPVIMTEEMYENLTGMSVSVDYLYTEGGVEYFYDYDRNLGVVPSDPSSPLIAARQAVLDVNEQQDRPEWIQYISSHLNWGSQWAMLKFVVGDGTWSANPSVQASPFPALISGNTTTTTYEVDESNLSAYSFNFDQFARSVVWYYKASDGKEYICGERSCEDGSETALWDWNGGSPLLLGTSKNYSTGYCECGGLQSAHEGRVIAELPNGDIIVQTLCSLFKYDPYQNRIENKLVPWPIENDGHPGGRSLVSHKNTVSFTTESFGGGGENPIAAQFYNTYETRGGDSPGTMTGTVAHVDGNLAAWKGSIYGITQSDHDVSEAMQYVAKVTAEGWTPTAMSAFETTRYYFNRVARVGWHLIANGSYRDTQNPLFLSNDGFIAEFGDFSYRIRQCAPALNPSGYETGLAPGALKTDIGLLPKRLIEIGDRSNGRILDSEPELEVDCPHAKCQFDEFGEGAVWFKLNLNVWSGETSGIAVYDTGQWDAPSQVKSFTEYFEEMLAVKDMILWARIDSDEDADDLETYNLPVPHVGDLWMLPRAAREKVEVVVVLPAEAEAITPPRLQTIC